jgi:hypothetical protein
MNEISMIAAVKLPGGPQINFWTSQALPVWIGAGLCVAFVVYMLVDAFLTWRKRRRYMLYYYQKDSEEPEHGSPEPPISGPK